MNINLIDDCKRFTIINRQTSKRNFHLRSITDGDFAQHGLICISCGCHSDGMHSTRLTCTKMTGNVVCRFKIDCFIRPADKQQPIHLSNYATKTLDCIMYTHQVNAKSRDAERGGIIKTWAFVVFSCKRKRIAEFSRSSRRLRWVSYPTISRSLNVFCCRKSTIKETICVCVWLCCVILCAVMHKLTTMKLLLKKVQNMSFVDYVLSTHGRREVNFTMRRLLFLTNNTSISQDACSQQVI